MIKQGNTYILCDECPFSLCMNEEYNSCDKIGVHGRYCEDAWIGRSVHKKKNPRKTGRAYRRKMKVQKEDRLYHIVKNHYMPHVGWVDWKFNGRTLHGTPYYFKDSSHSRKQRWLKKQTARKVRHMDIANGNYYRKCYEYWWNMY